MKGEGEKGEEGTGVLQRSREQFDSVCTETSVKSAGNGATGDGRVTLDETSEHSWGETTRGLID